MFVQGIRPTMHERRDNEECREQPAYRDPSQCFCLLNLLAVRSGLMTEVITNELMYEVLKRIQDDVAVIKKTVTDHSRILVRMREDDLRLESLHVETQLRLDRIETRLDLTDAS